MIRRVVRRIGRLGQLDSIGTDPRVSAGNILVRSWIVGFDDEGVVSPGNKLVTRLGMAEVMERREEVGAK